MILVVDSTALVLLINPDASPPIDPQTNQPLAMARERIEKLIAELDAKTDVIIVPTPVLAEVLVKAGVGAPEILAQLGALARIRVRPFDERGAIEVAAMTIEAMAAGDKKSGHDQPWQKVKFDRQIIAIARVNGATNLYADDKSLCAFASTLGMSVVSTWQLPTPEAEIDLFTAAGVPMVNPVADGSENLDDREAAPDDDLSAETPANAETDPLGGGTDDLAPGDQVAESVRATVDAPVENDDGNEEETSAAPAT